MSVLTIYFVSNGKWSQCLLLSAFWLKNGLFFVKRVSFNFSLNCNGFWSWSRRRKSLVMTVPRDSILFSFYNHVNLTDQVFVVLEASISLTSECIVSLASLPPTAFQPLSPLNRGWTLTPTPLIFVTDSPPSVVWVDGFREGVACALPFSSIKLKSQRGHCHFCTNCKSTSQANEI